VAKKLKVYIESTIPSYLVARPNKDLLVLAHQQVTKEWWKKAFTSYELFISTVVIEEIEAGDAVIAAKRKEALKGIEILKVTDGIGKLAETYMVELSLPKKAERDALHLAVAVTYEMDNLVTWNSTHIANENIRELLRDINKRLNLKTPHISTPEELI
jgi:hypothetical protein